jgi:hypothetical protein
MDIFWLEVEAQIFGISNLLEILFHDDSLCLLESIPSLYVQANNCDLMFRVVIHQFLNPFHLDQFIDHKEKNLIVR